MEIKSDQETRPEMTPRHLLYTLVGWGLQLVFGFLAFASGLVAPPAGVAVIIATWAATAIYSVMKWRQTPWIPLAMGVLAGALWVAIVSFGDAFLGWTA